MRKTILAILIITALPSLADTKPMDKRVAALIEQTLNKEKEAQAFVELEKLGCAAVPFIIRRMDDRRKLPVRYIRLENHAKDAFEAFRQYGPEEVVDALAAILNQVTGQHFEFIYNGGTKEERDKSVKGWREFLAKTPAEKLCD